MSEFTNNDSKRPDSGIMYFIEEMHRQAKEAARNSSEHARRLIDAQDAMETAARVYNAITPPTLEIPDGYDEEQMNEVTEDILIFTKKILDEIVKFGIQHREKHGAGCMDEPDRLAKIEQEVNGNA